MHRTGAAAAGGGPKPRLLGESYAFVDHTRDDRGSQYTSLAFGETMQDAGVTPSMGGRGDAFDNAAAESFFATLETELLDRHTFRTRDQTRLALFHWIEGFYKSRRRHSTLEQRSSERYEEIMMRQELPTAVTVKQRGVNGNGQRPDRLQEGTRRPTRQRSTGIGP